MLKKGLFDSMSRDSIMKSSNYKVK